MERAGLTVPIRTMAKEPCRTIRSPSRFQLERNGAQKRTRTSTILRPPAPEAGASTNSAIWARVRIYGPDTPLSNRHALLFGLPMRARQGRRSRDLRRRRFRGTTASIMSRSAPVRPQNPTHVADRRARSRHAVEYGNFGDRLRRLGLPRPPCGAGAGQARLSHPCRGAPAGPRRPPPAARPRRPDQRRAGQPALSGLGSGRRAGRRSRHQSRRHPEQERRARPSRRCRRRARAAVGNAAKAAGARLVHVSAIGADANSPSRYAQTKARGEPAVFEAVPNATVFRPSIMFGPEDDFFNRFATLARISPMLPLIGGGHTHLQPVFVGDVAQRDRRCRGRQGEDAAHLRARRAAHRDDARGNGIHACHDRALAPARAAALRARQAEGDAGAAIRAGISEAHARPGRVAQEPTTSSRTRRRPQHDARRPRHHVRDHGSDRADLSLALPPHRPVPQQGGVTFFVIAGPRDSAIDPAIRSCKSSFEERWMPGSSPGMTAQFAETPCVISHPPTPVRSARACRR